jgi:Peptidase family M23
VKSIRLLITLILAAGLVGYAVWKSSRTDVAEVKVVGFQDFDVPFAMPASGKPDMRFHFLTAWQTNRIPTASKMDTPMGSENGALVYNAQKFWEMNDQRGGHHTGDDLNGIGGMNTDLGDPVFAAGDGLVVYAGEPSPGWGNIIVLAHRDPQGKPIHTMYAHLHTIKATLDSLVARGEVIGTVGTAGGYYPAHLHFEARASDGVDIGAGYVSQPLNRLDPAALVAALHNADADGISPAALKYAELAPEAPWTTLEMKGAEKFSELKK